MQSPLRLVALIVLTVIPGLLPVSATGIPGTDIKPDVLTGDTRLACEAILCLSSGSRPSECSPSLSHYFGIKKKKLSDTLNARLNFLELCPASEDSPAMKSLVRAISKGAGRCDAQSLNTALGSWWGASDGGYAVISDKRPTYCSVYASHEYTDFAGDLPRYVGKPEELGYWVEARDYEHELAKYEKALAERKAREKDGYGYGYQGD
ncbi:conjugal transfer protein TrbM [Achromobacter xylosoxidans]|uniref:TrbM/KikA/MpfK family conjugal transfer protein n=1 Tax=Alcaligenes xylosoxydans xylosoxydans TaxID=85698 RepID=UPI001F0696BF|nr:TrbM/KikA/MpfK family conjugal transfer protein [Achromobacter xylosoxidans]MCH1986455.1 conjugal transfer protein TrbM [Achromobacter xylosoxidans]MCH1993107.1 conjugal transfer protein TrbM [Achromobacter xylosoxidans]MCH4588266.1 conjugal transfer protein TrbM [Achromobacter xylosoxidans]